MTVCLSFALAGFAQSSSASSQSNPDQSAASSSSQSGNQDNSMQSGSSGNAGQADQGSSANQGNNLEGCVVRQETEYFIQPVSGSRIALNGGSQDLSQYVGKDVRVHGRWNPYRNNNADDHQATTQPSGAPITGSASTGEGSNNGQQLFLVTRVDKISDTCPTGTPGNTSNPQ